MTRTKVPGKGHGDPHSKHEMDPLTFVYVPTAQVTHADDASGEYVPVPQSKHAVAFVSFEYFPPPQSTQALATVAPVMVEYLPALQLSHALAPVLG